MLPWILGTLAVLMLALLFYIIGQSSRGMPIEQARKQFLQGREHLEARFFAEASRSGKPRGLRWKDIEFETDVQFARELQSGRLTALVGISISFEAIEGSDMEGLPAVGNLRNATAVFFHHAGQWHTTGKAVFNLNPDEVIARFSSQYERVLSGNDQR